MSDSYEDGLTTMASRPEVVARTGSSRITIGSGVNEVEPSPEPSIGELFGRLTSDTSELLRAEVRLAKAEIKQEVKIGAKGAGALGAAGFAGYMALLLLSFAAAWGLAEVVAPGVAFLVMGVLYAVVAAVLAVRGKSRLAALRPVPEQTVETLKEDARWLKKKK